MKQTNAKSGFQFLLLYLLLSVMILIGISLVFDPPKPPSSRETVHYMDKADLFEIVRNNTQTILDDIKKNDFRRTLDLLSSSRKEPHVYFEDGCVTFWCFGYGFGSGTHYGGFYYTPWDGPADIGGIAAPYSGYHLPSGEELIQALKQEGSEWVWYETDVNPSGDNEYHTEKICDHFWHYRLVY